MPVVVDGVALRSVALTHLISVDRARFRGAPLLGMSRYAQSHDDVSLCCAVEDDGCSHSAMSTSIAWFAGSSQVSSQQLQRRFVACGLES